MQKLEHIVSFTIEILLVIIVALITLISILHPRDNLISWQMCVGTILTVSLLITTYVVWTKRLIFKIGKWNDICFFAGIIIYTLFLYSISIVGRNAVFSFQDYANVYLAAEELADGVSSDVWNYFLIYPNNFKPTLYLGFLISASKNILKIQDPYYIILFFSVIQVPVAIFAARYLTGRTQEERRKNQCIVLLLFILLLPIIGNVQFFYSDAMSFCMAITSVSLFVYATEMLTSKARRKALLFAGLAGILLALGITIKITILIPVIAGGILICFYKREKYWWYVVWVALIFAIATYGIIELYANTYDIYRQSHDTANPIMSWVALGLRGDGSYSQNYDFVEAINMMSTKAEKEAYTSKFMSENAHYLWDLEHIFQKIQCNFASGNMGLKDAFYYGEDQNILWNLFSPWGKYYWRTSQINFSYLFAILTIYLLGSISNIISLIKAKALCKRMLWTDLSIIGIFIFLMLWEANNRQLYNQMPILLLGAIYHLQHIASGKRRFV